MATPIETYLVDLNLFAISFIENHPGFPYIQPVFDAWRNGEFSLAVPEYLPFRTYWVFASKWKLKKTEATSLLVDFFENPFSPLIVGLTREGIQFALQLSQDLKHDIYDCYFLAIAKQEELSGILTTDLDFEKLCPDTNLKYWNPVPQEILESFVKYEG